MIAAGSFLAWATLVAATVDVQSTTECPSSAAVAERLLPLLPARDAVGAQPDRAQIESLGDADAPTGLRLRLYRPDGHLIGDRQMASMSSCSEAADAVAAIVAAWETAPEAPAAEAPPAPLAVTPSAPIVVPPTPAPTTSRRFALDVGGGAGVAFVGGAAAVGTLEVAAGLAEQRWQLRLAAATTTSRQSELAGGHVDWRYTTFSAGLSVRTLHPRWRLSLDAGPILGWATLAGVDFSPSRSERSFVYGGTAGLRLTRWFGGFAVWAEARTTAFVNVVEARATGPTETKTVDLPQLDASASLGIAARIFQ